MLPVLVHLLWLFVFVNGSCASLCIFWSQNCSFYCKKTHGIFFREFANSIGTSSFSIPFELNLPGHHFPCLSFFEFLLIFSRVKILSKYDGKILFLWWFSTSAKMLLLLLLTKEIGGNIISIFSPAEKSRTGCAPVSGNHALHCNEISCQTGWSSEFDVSKDSMTS